MKFIYCSGLIKRGKIKNLFECLLTRILETVEGIFFKIWIVTFPEWRAPSL